MDTGLRKTVRLEPIQDSQNDAGNQITKDKVIKKRNIGKDLLANIKDALHRLLMACAPPRYLLFLPRFMMP